MNDPASSPPARARRQRWLVLIPIVGGTCLLLTALVLILVLSAQGALPWARESDPGMPVEVVKLTPSAGGATPVAPGTAPSCETVISSNDTQTVVPLPVYLSVDERGFPVVAVAPSEGSWVYPPDKSGAAAWVCGTVVNYILELEPTPENQGLLANLSAGAEIRLRLSGGKELLFRFAEREEVWAGEPSVLLQVRPRLTLITAQEGQWQVTSADYVAEAEAAAPPSSALAELNQVVPVGDVQLLVTEGYAVRSGMALQPGTIAYLVEFSLENVGTQSLSADHIGIELQDGAGNRYLLSPAASALGKNGPLAGEIAPGTVAQGSAGYIVPEMLSGPTLIWTFIPRPDRELQTSVAIPYESVEQPVALDRFEVTITDAFLNLNGDTLNIEGEIRNTGDGPLTVRLEQISLTSSAGLSDVRLAAPPLPWVIDPGQTQVIELQYAKPDAPAALLTLLGYSFEIQGLQ